MRKKHGQSNTRLYGIYNGMKQRCNNPKSQGYQYYGAKGIKVCDEWQNDFMAFKEWADANGYDDTLTIDRIDPQKHYCPENCRWLTINENSARAIFSRDHKSWEKKTKSNYMAWLKEYGEQKEIDSRIEAINKTISSLANLDKEQLSLLDSYIEWLQAAKASNQRKI